MRRAFLAATLLSTCSFSALAWERLVTQNDAVVEGEIVQPEFVLIDATGGEVVIPRAAILRFEGTSAGLKATIKDGTEVIGALQGKLEIGDGLIRRRYGSGDIKSVEFDRYIVVAKGKEYISCPIRVEIDAGVLLLGDERGLTTAAPRAITCKDLRIATFALSPKGKIKPGKEATLESQFILTVPEGEAQLVELAARLVQGENSIAKESKRLTLAPGDSHTVTFNLTFRGETLDLAGPAPRVLIQLVSQDAKREVEKGGFFWWFTIPLG